jgi:hypothetical protein
MSKYGTDALQHTKGGDFFLRGREMLRWENFMIGGKNPTKWGTPFSLLCSSASVLAYWRYLARQLPEVWRHISLNSFLRTENENWIFDLLQLFFPSFNLRFGFFTYFYIGIDYLLIIFTHLQLLHWTLDPWRDVRLFIALIGSFLGKKSFGSWNEAQTTEILDTGYNSKILVEG